MGSFSRLVGIALVLFVVSSARSYAERSVVPFSADLHLDAGAGEAASSRRADFSRSTAPANFVPYLRNFTPNTSPDGEAFVGLFGARETVHFGMRATFRDDTAWGFSNGNDQSSGVAFTDMDNSLWMGGRVIERTGVSMQCGRLVRPRNKGQVAIRWKKVGFSSSVLHTRSQPGKRRRALRERNPPRNTRPQTHRNDGRGVRLQGRIPPCPSAHRIDRFAHALKNSCLKLAAHPPQPARLPRSIPNVGNRLQFGSGDRGRSCSAVVW